MSKAETIERIEGTFKLADGTEHEFAIGKDGGWHQWGGNVHQLGKTAIAIGDIAEAAREYLVSDYSEGEQRYL